MLRHPASFSVGNNFDFEGIFRPHSMILSLWLCGFVQLQHRQVFKPIFHRKHDHLCAYFSCILFIAAPYKYPKVLCHLIRPFTFVQSLLVLRMLSSRFWFPLCSSCPAPFWKIHTYQATGNVETASECIVRPKLENTAGDSTCIHQKYIRKRVWFSHCRHSNNIIVMQLQANFLFLES